MTCAEIGNYGVSADDVESRKPQVAGFVIRDESPVASNWRAQGTLRDYLVVERHRRHLGYRHAGADAPAALGRCHARRDRHRQRAGRPRRLSTARSAIPKMEGSDLVRGVTSNDAFDWPDEDPGEFDVTPEHRAKRRLKIAAYDFGMKWNILRRLSAHGCDVRVYPAITPAAELLASGPDGVFLSNGPGDPAPLTYAIDNAKALVGVRRAGVRHLPRAPDPRPGAWAATTFKLKFGHRGANHPVKKLATGKIEITSQNHGFAVDPDSLPADVEVTHRTCTTAPSKGSGIRRSRCSRCSTTPRPRPARTMPTTCSATSSS